MAGGGLASRQTGNEKCELAEIARMRKGVLVFPDAVGDGDGDCETVGCVGDDLGEVSAVE